MRKRKFSALFVLVFVIGIVLSSSITAMADSNQINVKIDGKTVAFDVAPTMIDGRILVPFRAVFEALGGRVEWDSKTNTAKGYKGAKTVQLPINKKVANVNERKVFLDVPAQVINDRTLVPLRFVSENLGAKVTWDDKTNTAIIETSAESSTKAEAGYQKISVGTLTEPPEMNSILTTDTTSHTMQNHVNEGLLRKGKDGKPIPGLAESWESSKDGLVWTFHIRESKWSDSTPISAKDFEFAFLEVLKPHSASEYAYLFYTFKNGEAYNFGKAKREQVGVKALDDRTLQLTLERPAPFLLTLLTFENFAPVNKEFYEKQGNQYGKEADKLLYSGPWIICDWQHDNGMCLIKNPYYWNAKNIQLDEINFSFIKDSNTKINLFAENKIDITNVSNFVVNQMKEYGYKILDYTDGSTWYMEFNTKDPIMKNRNIRKALSYGINRQNFINETYKFKSKPALNYTAPVISGEAGSFVSELGPLVLDGNVEEAKKYLQKGLEELGLSTLPKLYLLADDTDSAKIDAKALTSSWKSTLGIDVEVNAKPFKNRLEDMRNKNFQMVMAGWSADYDDPISFLDMFETGNGNNHTGFSSREYDTLLRKVFVEGDPKKRMDMLKDLERILMYDMPIAPVYHRYRYYVSKDNINGVVRNWNQDIDLYWTSVSK